MLYRKISLVLLELKPFYLLLMALIFCSSRKMKILFKSCIQHLCLQKADASQHLYPYIVSPYCRKASIVPIIRKHVWNGNGQVDLDLLQEKKFAKCSGYKWWILNLLFLTGSVLLSCHSESTLCRIRNFFFI